MIQPGGPCKTALTVSDSEKFFDHILAIEGQRVSEQLQAFDVESKYKHDYDHDISNKRRIPSITMPALMTWIIYDHDGCICMLTDGVATWDDYTTKVY